MRAPTAGTASRASSPPELVYVIRNGHGHIKVGASGDPLQRLDTLQTGSSTRLELVYAAAVKSNNAFPVEAAAKSALAAFKIHEGGDEWFAVDATAGVAAIAAASHALADPIVEIAKEHLRYVVDRARAETPIPVTFHTKTSRLLWRIFFALLAFGVLIFGVAIYNTP